MFDIFLKHFKDNNVTEFEAKTSDGNVVRFFKLYIDWYTFIIYAAITNRKSEDDISGILYHIIGMGDDENKRSVFFLNETSKKLFTQEELTELSSIANTPLLDFESIKNAIRKAMDGSAPEKYIHKIPDAESIATIRNHFIDKDFVKFSFSKNPEEDIVQDVVDAIDDYSHVLMFDGTITFDLVGVRGKWAKNIAVTFLYSVFQPEFPFYNFSNEKNKYVSRILKRIKKARKNKRSLSYKYHAIPGAVQKYDNVTIDFLDSEKRPRTITVKSAAYSYVAQVGGKEALAKKLGREPKHSIVDIRFEKDGVVVLIETKRQAKRQDQDQLGEYMIIEKALHPGNKIIGILANTNDDEVQVWQGTVDEDHFMSSEKVLNTMEHYVSLFRPKIVNNREVVLKNTYALNELLHKKDIDEKLRSQFVGTVLLYIKSLVKEKGIQRIDDSAKDTINAILSELKEAQIRTGIEEVLTELLDGSSNKSKKIELLQKNVLGNQKVKALNKQSWIEIVDAILMGIYRYINEDSAEGQDILNLFFIAFNKYTGKADKNQAFTPDHITEFMCRITDVDHTKRILDGTCGSASFLVQAMVKELASCRIGNTDEKAAELQDRVKHFNIYGIEVEEKAFGLSVTNMLIHGDGNSNIILGSCFDRKSQEFIKDADPDIILMNPPYNAKPIGIPDKYKKNWGKAKDGKEDPTKGLVFVQYFADIIEKNNKEKIQNGINPKPVKMAVLLPLACAIGTSNIIHDAKAKILKNNTLEAVFSLPAEIFYPGSSVCVCCMLFTLGQPHVKADGTVRSTFFGYCKDDGFVKKKNLGRIEQFSRNAEGEPPTSKWKAIETEWLDLFERKAVVDGKSAVERVGADDEWLCEAYMKTDYSTLTEADFQRTLNNYLAYLVKEGQIGCAGGVGTDGDDA